MHGQCEIGIAGLGVMGAGLLKNFSANGIKAAGYDRNNQKFAELQAVSYQVTADLDTFIALLQKPFLVLLLLPAGEPVDDFIHSLLPYLEKDDMIIDGGNSYFKDTSRRQKILAAKGIGLVGMGISGGEAGALHQPGLMPGGDPAYVNAILPLFQKIAGENKVLYTGNGAAGHFTKMVHNGIEYALMQIISEAYDILKKSGKDNPAAAEIFACWNKGLLHSYLIGITSEILSRQEEASREFVLDQILDVAASKGTGKWTCVEAMDLSVPVPCIDAAVYTRSLSLYKQERVDASKRFTEKAPQAFPEEDFAGPMEKALFIGFFVTYLQGIHLLCRASEVYGMEIKLKNVLQIWKNGCIISSAMIDVLEKASQQVKNYPGMETDLVSGHIKNCLPSLQNTISFAMKQQIPTPGLSAALNYMYGFTNGTLPVNLIQAQRDFFGAHGFKKNNEEGNFHVQW